MSQVEVIDWKPLSKELYQLRGESTQYQSAFKGWKRYLCKHVGYAEQDLQEAGEIVGKNINNNESINEAVEHVFVCQTLYSTIASDLLRNRLDSENFESSPDTPLYESINISNPIVPSVFRWFEKDDLTSNTKIESQKTDLYNQLQNIYNELFPGSSRKALGEFYTPEWLVQHVIDGIQIDNSKRLIDPNCGAGAFINALFDEQSKSDSEDYLNSIHGYEINPVSVVAAKCIYIDNLKDCLPLSTETRLPIYQVNSLLLPDGLSVSNGSSEQMVFNEGELKNPIESSIEEIENEYERELVATQKEDTEVAKKFRPYSIVVGNPPWISWENLGKSARDRIEEPLKTYGLVEGKVRVGALKVDSATLSLYLAADHLLEDGGQLGYVITESVFKAKSMGGFRRFELPDAPLKVRQIDDFTDIQPFEDATNRTGVVWLERGSYTKFPVEYRTWKKTGNDLPEMLEADCRQAFPLGDDMSNPWIAVDDEVAGYLENVSGGQDYYQPRVGINTAGGSGVYWVEIEKSLNGTAIVSNEYTAGRKDYPDMGSFEVEKEFLYPLIHGRHISRWDVEVPDRLIIIPHTKETGIKPIAESETKNTKLYSYFSSSDIKELLSNRRAIGNRWGGTTNKWYSLFEVGKYTFAPYKVVYRGQAASEIVAAVANGRSIEGLGEKMVMPNQTAHFVPLWSEDEAHYVCGILNSAPVRYLYQCFDYKHPGTFFIKVLNIPKFDPKNEIHESVSSLGKSLHNDGEEELYDKLDKNVGELWGIPPDRISQIQEYI